MINWDLFDWDDDLTIFHGRQTVNGFMYYCIIVGVKLISNSDSHTNRNILVNSILAIQCIEPNSIIPKHT